MPIDQIVNLQDGDEVRTILNSVVTQVNTNTSDIANKQPLDADLTAIAALTPINDDFMQRKSGAWANRTIAQVKTDLAISNVDNTSDANKPVSTAQAAADAAVLASANTYTDNGLSAKQAINAADTLNWTVTLDNASKSINLLTQNKVIYVTTGGNTYTVFQAGTFPLGGEFHVFNNAGADVNLAATGGASIIYNGALTSVVAANKYAVVVRLTATIFVRIA